MNLVSQRYRSDLIRLNLDPDTAAGLSESCKKIIRRHAIEVHETTRDIGSYGKLIPTMLDYPQSTIITADDDTYYPKNWAFGLVKAQRRYPRCTIGYRAHQIHTDEDGNPLQYSEWDSHLKQPACGPNVVLTGVSGILYPPGSLAAEALDIDKFMVIAPSADDLWFWRMTIMAGYTPRKIGPKVYNYGWDDQSSTSLADYNVGHGGNDRAMAEILKKYPINVLQKISPTP